MLKQLATCGRGVVPVVEIQELEIEQVDRVLMPMIKLFKVPAHQPKTTLLKEEGFEWYLAHPFHQVQVLLVDLIDQPLLHQCLHHEPVRYVIPQILLLHSHKCLSVKTHYVVYVDTNVGTLQNRVVSGINEQIFQSVLAAKLLQDEMNRVATVIEGLQGLCSL